MQGEADFVGIEKRIEVEIDNILLFTPQPTHPPRYSKLPTALEANAKTAVYRIAALHVCIRCKDNLRVTFDQWPKLHLGAKFLAKSVHWVFN